MEATQLVVKDHNDAQSATSIKDVQDNFEALTQVSEVSKNNANVKPEVDFKTKRVSFHFDTDLNTDCETKTNDSKDISLNTVQNIYETKNAVENRVSVGDTVYSESNQEKINKLSYYIKSHRQNFLSTNNSSADQLKGRYKNIVKQTDNNLTVNTDTLTKIHIDNNSNRHSKDYIDKNNKITAENVNLQEENLAKVLCPENNSNFFVRDQTLKPGIVNNKNNANSGAEDLLSKTTSNIEKLQNNLTRLSKGTLEKLRYKYSPVNFGYSKHSVINDSEKEKFSRIPVPTPRASIKNSVNKVENNNEKVLPCSTANSSKFQRVTVKAVPTFEKITPNNDEKSDSLISNQTLINVAEPQQLIPKSEISLNSPVENEEFLPILDDADVGIELQVSYENIKFAEPEEKHFIVCRSSSEDSVNKVQSFFSEIIMEKVPKEKKRKNSFRKILTAGIFGRDKKKPDDDVNKHKGKDQAVFADNAQNESQAFNRSSTHRHTIDNSFPRRGVQRNTLEPNHSSGPLYCYTSQPQIRKTSENIRNRYTEMKGTTNFPISNDTKYSPEDYEPMENRQLNYRNINKYIDTSSSSSNTLDSDNRNCTYQNALIAQAELRQIRENENKTAIGNAIPVMVGRMQSPSYQEKRYNFVKGKLPELPRENSSKNLQLVKPKALIPINSERPLPNPYHNIQHQTDNGNYQNIEVSKTIDRNLNLGNSKPFPQKSNLYNRNDESADRSTNRSVVVEEIYGTVFDSIAPQKSEGVSKAMEQNFSNNSIPSNGSLSPKSLESSKLRLPLNREKVELQPRIKSPIPQTKISTDKIIATELLRNKRSPSRKSPNEVQQKLDHASPTRPSSFQGNANFDNDSNLSRKHTPLIRNNSNNSVAFINTHSSPCNSHASNEYVYLNPVPPLSKQSPINSIAREASAFNCLQAAEWQRKQRELDKSPALENSHKITTNVMVHTYPEEDHLSFKNNLKYPSEHSLAISEDVFRQQNQISPSRLSNNPSRTVRPQTPVNQQSSPVTPKSPEKQQILQNVEAFYWRELKKLKDQEEKDLLNYRQQQLHTYRYVEDPGLTRRSRSVSPSMIRGRRSLSLPRDNKPAPISVRMHAMGQEPIPEGRPVICRKPISEPPYGQVQQPFQRNPNFIRNTFERSTIGPIGMNKNSQLYENCSPRNQREYKQAPIFKRGSLTNPTESSDMQSQMSKKVSFSNTQNPNNLTSWPTKNGFTKSPPTRRVDREISLDDDVFLPTSPRAPDNRYPKDTYGNRETPYMSNYKTEYALISPEKAPQTSKHITVSNKICDIYGQIHDSGQSSTAALGRYNQNQNFSPSEVDASHNYGQIKQVGLVYGQLQNNAIPNNSAVLHPSYNRLSAPQSNFVRGTRLTASANDMYRKYPVKNYMHGRQDQNQVIYSNDRVMQAPQRPLPPLPERKDSQDILSRRFLRGYFPISDTESSSEAGEIQRILQSGSKQKHIGVIGK